MDFFRELSLTEFFPYLLEAREGGDDPTWAATGKVASDSLVNYLRENIARLPLLISETTINKFPLHPTVGG
jgi:hypothetical protein